MSVLNTIDNIINKIDSCNDDDSKSTDTSSNAPAFALKYFPIGGRGGCIRIAAYINNVSYREEFLAFDEAKQEKAILVIKQGLVDEAKNLLNKYDLDLNHPLRKSVNYKQAFEFIEKKHDHETFFDKALFATRQLAKRQTTWIRSWDKFKEIDLMEP